MKYFNKEDIEYKEYNSIQQRKFGDISGFGFNEVNNDLSVQSAEVNSTPINNVDIRHGDYLGTDYNISPHYYLEAGKYNNIEANVEMLDLFLRVNEPQTGEPVFQMSYGTSDDSIWLFTGSFVNTTSARYFWETNYGTPDCQYKYDDRFYSSVQNSRFSTILKGKTSEIYKIYAKLIMGDREAKIKIKNSNGIEETFDDALFIHFNKNYEFSDLELGFYSCPDSFLLTTKEISPTDQIPRIIYSGSINFYNECSRRFENKNDKIVEILDKTRKELNLFNLTYTENRLYSFTIASQYLIKRIFLDKNAGSVKPDKNFSIGFVVPEYNLVVLRPSTNVYMDDISLNENNSFYKVFSNCLIPSTAFINGAYFYDVTDSELGFISGSSHYNNKTFVDIVTTNSEDSYFELLMGFKSRLERIYLTQNKKETIAEYSCIAEQNEFNYSNNQSFLDENRNIRNVVPAAEDSEDGDVTTPAHTYITRIGLYNDQNQLLAVGNLSQPIKKDFNTKRFFRVKLKN